LIALHHQEFWSLLVEDFLNLFAAPLQASTTSF
jgi:hypothetical protein